MPSNKKKDYGRLVRIPDDVYLALEIICEMEYRSIPQQVEKFLRENPEINKHIHKVKKKKKNEIKERYDGYSMIRVQKSTMKRIAINAEKNNRTKTKQIEKYLTEAIAKGKKKGRKK